MPKSIGNYRHLHLVSVHTASNNERSARGGSDVNALHKFKSAGFKGLFYKLAGAIDTSIYSTGTCRIGVLGDNELQRLVLSNLLRQRVSYKHFNLPEIECTDAPADVINSDILTENWCYVERQLNFVKNHKARELVEKSLKEIFLQRFQEARKFSNSFKNFFAAQPQLTHLLVPFIKGAKAIGLRDAAQKCNVKIVACQHGITRELVEKTNFRFMMYETVYCDFYFTYNPRAKVITEKFGLNGNRVIVNDLKFPHRLQSKYPRKSRVVSNPKILYVSTVLNIGNRPNGIQFKSDLDKFNFESSIINKVLKKTGKKIYYKPYIAYRFIDRDPLMQLVSESDNICIVDTHRDLRYTAQNYDVYIASQATSTLAWLVLENKPLIYIDDDKTSRLEKGVLPDFQKSFFYFDGATEDFHSKIRSFLSLDPKVIYSQWDKKYTSRVAFLRHYCFGSDERVKKSIRDAFDVD